MPALSLPKDRRGKAILMGEEPSGLSLTKLTSQLTVMWADQRKELGMY